MPGILTPYVYLGMLFTYFGLHIKDGDLNSINFLHRGAWKMWYSIPKTEKDKLEALVKKLAAELGISCTEYLRHKTLLITPTMLHENDIRFTRVSFNELHHFFSFLDSFCLLLKVIQRPGEFVVLFSGCFHMGFNLGLNEAEAINFATSSWVSIFPTFKICKCKCVNLSLFSLLLIYHINLLRVIFLVFVTRKFSSGPKVIQKKLRAVYDKYKSLALPEHAIESLAAEFPAIEASANETGFKCMECSTVISYKKNFLKHMRNQHGKKFKLYHCPYCPAKRNDVYNMRDHILEKHDETMKIDEVEKFGKMKIRTKKSSYLLLNDCIHNIFLNFLNSFLLMSHT